ncbi:hypothetical protein [Nocardia goodfellowii]|uniref:Uncharacterized protein n=1 Tax=Nocardia goodfellowii TaxID=882446 RepID=A0ABS4Q8E6_9NOCA|nr:hypothetical protein [Nocardia goodfellowii]MBP2187972.1 hypothetical protein [Nocardia goodfellowii]
MRSTRVVSLAALAFSVVLPLSSGPAAADSADTGVLPALDYGGGCVLDPQNKAATVQALRFQCTPEQQDAIYNAAEAGAVPQGVKNGWVVRPGAMSGAAAGMWLGKTFHTGPDGGWLMNRVTGAGIEAWRADVYRAPALTDGRETWALDYSPSPTPPVYDEIREVAPGVWYGYSWWRGALQTVRLLAFLLY